MNVKFLISSSLICVTSQFSLNKNNRPSQFDEKSGEIQGNLQKVSESHEKRRK